MTTKSVLTERPSVKKETTARSSKVRPFKKAEPPPDNPLLRHRELSLKSIVAEEGPRSALASAAAAGVAASSLRAAITTRAQLRLAALRESRRMPSAGTSLGPPAAGPLAATAGPALLIGRAAADQDDAAAGVTHWVQLGPTAIPNGQTQIYSSARVLVTGRVTAIVVDPLDPKTIYIGAAQGGVWKTTDGGKNWLPKTDDQASQAIGALALDPGDNRVIYAGTGEGNFSLDSYYGAGVLKSGDAGDTWTLLATETFEGKRFSRIAATPGTPDRLFAATGDGLYRSTNGGNDWKKMSGGGLPADTATDVVIDPDAPATVYAAFYGRGIWKTTNAGAAAPAWARLTSGLPSAGVGRIALGMSPSSPQVIYALMSASNHPRYTINRFFRTADGGATWKPVVLPGGNIGDQGFYNLAVAVAPTTPDIVYLCATSLWKAARNSATGAWNIEEIGADIHADNHAVAFDPTDHLTLYVGNDGGIYKSEDGGATWSDTINEGPCITQFEAIAQHPDSDAFLIGGTQDNGVEQFRNSPVFYHSDDGDGGFTAVDQNDPRTVYSTYYGNSPKRSDQAGEFGWWGDISEGVQGEGLFYPPMVLNDADQTQVAFGTDRINLDQARGDNKWPVKVDLPGIDSKFPVSAIHYVNSALVYVGTMAGQVYRLTNDGAGWAAAPIHDAPLPANPVMDIAARPDDENKVVVVLAEFDVPHVWRGDMAADGTVAWTDVSGSGENTTLPNAPVNALVIDPLAPDTYYVGTDVNVFVTTNGGATWKRFGDGLPTCAVFDMRLHNPTRLLRVATHGRGMWERRIEGGRVAEADLFVRDHLMDTGRQSPSPDGVAAAFADPLQHIRLGDRLWHWMCADIKVDSPEGATPAYQLDPAAVDYVAFEHLLEHRNASPGKINRVYVQLHNRGRAPATAVVAKLMYASAAAGLPPLPADFWTVFPDTSSDVTHWKPVGPAKAVTSLSPAEPVVIHWDWATPADAADNSCLLVVLDSAEDSIPAANKLLDASLLARTEKRVGLKSVMVSTAAPGAVVWTTLEVHPTGASQSIRVQASPAGTGLVGVLLPKTCQPKSVAQAKRAGDERARDEEARADLEGFAPKKLSQGRLRELRNKIGDEVEKYDCDSFYVVEDAQSGGLLKNIKAPRKGFKAMLLLTHPEEPGKGAAASVVLEADDSQVGGTTIVVRAAES